jgi:hypothetical protein
MNQSHEINYCWLRFLANIGLLFAFIFLNTINQLYIYANFIFLFHFYTFLKSVVKHPYTLYLILVLE